MRKTTFKFREQPSTAFGMVARPTADVVMRTPKGELFGIRMLVDSGADISILSPQIARILEINPHAPCGAPSSMKIAPAFPSPFCGAKGGGLGWG